MVEKGATVMAVAEEDLKEIEGRPARRRHAPGEEGVLEPVMNTAPKGNTHMSNERLLAAGGTVAGAALLGGAFGGVFGAAVGAVAGLGVALYTAKSKGKEGARRS
jgi:hypothetical protein